VQRYPRTERARGYLEGLSAAAALGIEALDVEALDGEAPDVEALDGEAPAEPCTSP
jgi:hypothetical protein